MAEYTAHKRVGWHSVAGRCYMLALPPASTQGTSVESSITALTPRVRYILAWGLIAFCGGFVFRWIFDPAMMFYVDDWGWLYRSHFGEWTAYTIFPKQVYNDRPVGALLIALCYHLFGLNYTPYAAMLLFIHVANGIAFSVLVARLLGSQFYGAIAGVLFVINLNVAYQAWWPGTIFDSTSLFFCICTFLSFLSKKRYSIIFTVLFYFLAVRSKEASLPFPFVLFAYSFLTHVASPRPSAILEAAWQAFKATWPLLLVFAGMFGLFIHYYLPLKAADFGPYAPKFDAWTMLDGLKIYLRYIMLDRPSLEQALIIYLALSAVALVTWTRAAIVGSVAFLIAATPVLVLATQRVPYYGYIPSPYLMLLIVALVQRADSFLSTRLAALAGHAVKVLVIAGAVAVINFVDTNGHYRDSLLTQMRENSQAMRTLRSAVSHVERDSKIVITGLPPGPLHLFAFAPCHVFLLAYEIRSVQCHLEGTEAELRAMYEGLSAPKLLLRYDRGTVSLVARSP